MEENLNKVMDDLVECGFDGIQSLQPSAGMDIASPGGGFILSTCNTMVDIIPPENILAMIDEAEKDWRDTSGLQRAGTKRGC